ncbi:hypothetical protein BAUCODRAFT_191233 [Baudoinia panamericana UAMH 10762]|uniref:Inclusion body clearance protein IML2 n=1 Tax=Baudoinia panamericana (strain UAMH 10762) TaxID=717646 RepID=M2NNC4_BAUPA|nr:uncharacterized protein BAUCODRAFT_191233 [Baudoinia panamericana UAMH 10762]EMD00990.1 hypothetical protein BAUCODRAFT_191233 [Baudoinia panamericana UAMH 10762]
MKRALGFLSSKAGVGASKSLTALDEPQALQDAMGAAAHIMNDEVELAEAELSKGTSPFHKLGLATALFLRATLGFEKEIMEQASTKLAEAEEAASEHQRRATRDASTAHQSKIYPAGSEYALCHAEAQLMSAVVGVLNESFTESLRGFYKLRRAFTTLYEISEAEKRYLRAHGIGGIPSASTSSSAATNGSVSGPSEMSSAESSGVLTPASVALGEAQQDVEKHGVHGGSLRDEDDLDDLDDAELQKLSDLSLEDTITKKLNDRLPNAQQPPSTTVDSSSSASQAEHDLDIRTITDDPIDLFIHAGTSLCFGLLQLLLSMVPPAFSRLLSIFSFRGDRETGMRMLWSATKFKHNINGAMAGLITLGFHNGAIAFCDILRNDALPEVRLRALLRDMRQLYPKSKLWLLEESRMLARDHNLQGAVDLTGEGAESELKQVNALRVFERALNCMYLHKYEESAVQFIDCVSKNSWSHALYYYIAGSCYVELYRLAKPGAPQKAAEYGAKADEYLHKVPEHTGKKRLMARQLPFDIFVSRKITKWDHRAKVRKCDFVDAVGVSPVEEMAYFWSGYGRMDEQQLQDSLRRLAWCEDRELNPHWEQEGADEKAVLSLLRGTILRFLGQTYEAKKVLTEGVLCHELVSIKACDHPDTWPLPVAHYEIAVCDWVEAGGQDGDKATLQQCSEQLAKVETWESYELETRIGLKVRTARETLRRCGIANP